MIFHLSKRSKAEFFILCCVIFLVRLQGRFELDHTWEWEGENIRANWRDMGKRKAIWNWHQNEVFYWLFDEAVLFIPCRVPSANSSSCNYLIVVDQGDIKLFYYWFVIFGKAWFKYEALSRDLQDKLLVCITLSCSSRMGPHMRAEKEDTEERKEKNNGEWILADGDWRLCPGKYRITWRKSFIKSKRANWYLAVGQSVSLPMP